ncbi:hypothetical protein QZH41_001654 [Actinostola sp. cb2023]|nr:hypothetical protein QZH41_001654 [Actinostola sp. cb2023]
MYSHTLSCTLIHSRIMSLNSRILRFLCQKNTSSAVISVIPKWRRPVPHVCRTNLRLLSSSQRYVEPPSAQELDTNRRSVFFGGLQPGTTEEMANEYFSKFGEVENVRLVKTFMGYSRNYGFVCFKSSTVAEEVLDENHVLQGKSIDVRRTKKYRVVYAGGLQSHFTEDIVKEHFSKFGNVESVQFIDHSRMQSKSGYAFITFTTIEEAARALSEENQVIEGCPVKVNSRESSEGAVEAEVSESRKIKVECLPFETTTVEQLRDYFEKFGALKAIDLLINSKTKTCAAIVMFEGVDGIQNALTEENHEIEGCKVHP